MTFLLGCGMPAGAVNDGELSASRCQFLTASLGAGRVSGHHMIDVIPAGDQRPGRQDVSVPGARYVARPPGTAHGPFIVGAEIACSVRRHLALSGVMLAGQARLAAGSMGACHEAINDGEGLVRQWRVTQLTRLGIPGPQAEADHAGRHQIARWSSAAVPHTRLAHRPLTGRLRRSRPR
jgi:hypothetical protein